MNSIKIALFSEGKNYFSTFKPIIQSFIENEIDFKYYSFYKTDPVFKFFKKIKCSYIGKGFFGHLKFAFLSADFLITTTPNIGTKGYPLKKPKNVKSLIHIFHSISDIAIYKKGSLDNYDSVFLVGKFQIPSIRFLENKRKTKEKELTIVGAPYLDYLLHKKIKSISDGNTILVASSWGAKGCLKTYGIEFIIHLASNGFKIILRPHPQSNISEPEYIKHCKKELSAYSNIEWDEEISPLVSMSKADLLISDTSSIRFDYFFLYRKPIVTLEIDEPNMKGYEQEDLENKNKLFNDFFGLTLNLGTINQISEKVKKLIKARLEKNYKDRVDKLGMPKIGSSGEKIAEFFKQKLHENKF